MLDTSVLGELTAAACAALTARQDAAALLHRIDTDHLFLVALDDERTSFRYHQLVSQTLRAELRAKDPARSGCCNCGRPRGSSRAVTRAVPRATS